MSYLNRNISGYVISRLIGQGGLAEVYEGVSEDASGRKVAIKILHDRYQADDELRKRFRREAEIMLRLNHPNIVKVLPIDPSVKTPVIIMELLKGRDLKQYLSQEGKLPIDVALSFFIQALNALEHAHSLGILHRDIKPSNIFVTKDMHVKVLDFGIAKAGGEGYEKTRTGVRMGSPAFMSPEQVNAISDPDPRSDIYSLGVTLYCMLTGIQPYDGIQSEYEIFNKIMNEPLPKTVEFPFMDIVIAKATAKKRENRYTDAGSFREAFMDAYVKTTSPTVVTEINDQETETEQPKSKRWLIAASISVLLVVGVLYQNAAPSSFLQYERFNHNGSTYEGIAYFSLTDMAYIPHGKGKTTLENDVTYSGNWNHGLREDFGSLQYSNGDFYSGDLDYFGVPNGKGKKLFSNGSMYEGNFINGQMSGQGTYTWTDQQSYVGAFLNDLMHGQGILKYNHYKYGWTEEYVTCEFGEIVYKEWK